MASYRNKTVFVGMSGGVDSSVAAVLLQEQGYLVHGAFMKNWSDTKDPVTGRCAWREEMHDAERVAVRLGIPFHVFDFESEYRKEVVEYLFREYEAGRTPNPDVLCNTQIKFAPFLKECRRQGADLIATGHYCRVDRRGGRGRYRLLAGVDRNKDQSYFLHQIKQRQLSRILFPVGHLPKSKVRQIARKHRLPVANKKDSQGICFIGKVKMKDFLAQRIKSRPGPIMDTDGKEVGRHQGMAPFTIGQRHGLGLSGGPWFVIEKRLKDNVLVVAQGVRNPALFSRELEFGQCRWVSGEAPAGKLQCKARIRYRQPLQAVTVTRPRPRGPWLARFDRRQRAITPGQFIVLYRGDSCLGGGTILR